jgi:hypothetical protein
MKKIHKIATVMFVLVACFSSQSMSAAATNLKCSGCVGKSDIAKNAVVSSRIKIGAVTSGKIKDGAVTREKLGFDVTDELYDLKTGKRSTIRTVIDIDCDTNANTLIEPPYIDNFFPNTTFNITGACNGPLHISSDGVRLIGMELDQAASIVLPNPTADPGMGAVFVEGASDVRIENLTIDASAWADINAQGTDSAGLLARQAFVRLKDVDVTGGLYGILAFRNALIRLEGTINITNFVNEGLGAGDQSSIQIRGTNPSPFVTVSTTNIAAESFTDDDYIVGLSTWRQGVIESRGVTDISVPAGHDAIGNYGQSHVRLKAGGTIVGNIVSEDLSITRINNGTITGELNAGDGAFLKVSGSTVTGDLDAANGSILNISGSTVTGELSAEDGSLNVSGLSTVTGDIHAERRSGLTVDDSTIIGDVNILNNAFGKIGNNSTVTGDVKIGFNSSGEIEEASTVTGVIGASDNSSLIVDSSTITGDMYSDYNSLLRFYDADQSGGGITSNHNSNVEFFGGSDIDASSGFILIMLNSHLSIRDTTTSSGNISLDYSSTFHAGGTAYLGVSTIGCLNSQVAQINIGGSVTGFTYSSCP